MRRFRGTLPPIILLLLFVHGSVTGQIRDTTAPRPDELVQAGQVAELSNDYALAAERYSEALEADPRDYRIATLLARSLIETGETARARLLLDDIVRQADTIELQRTAALLRARTYLIDGQYKTATIHASSLASGDNTAVVTPQYLFFLREAAIAAGDDDLRSDTDRRLARLYPESPERQLVTGNARHLPTPSRVFGSPIPPQQLPPVREAESTTRVARAIQTGSFRGRENAEYMVRDLEVFGFDAEIEVTGSDLYRVLVPVGAQTAAQEIVLRLKERGIEGFLLFEPTAD